MASKLDASFSSIDLIQASLLLTTGLAFGMTEFSFVPRLYAGINLVND
jgi:hypothetical protein